MLKADLPVEIPALATIDLLERLWRSFIRLLEALRGFILNGLGASGALSWLGYSLLALLDFLSFEPLYLYTVPVLACVIGLLAYLGYLQDYSKEGLLFEARKFLLTVCGASGATFFILTWFALIIPVATTPLGWMLLASAFMSFVAIRLVYFGDKNPGMGHRFLTQVLGAGGGTFWLLETLMLAASCTFNPLVLIIIPAFIMLCCAGKWYRENSTTIKTCLSSFSSPGKSPVQIAPTVEPQEEPERKYPGASAPSPQQKHQ